MKEICFLNVFVSNQKISVFGEVKERQKEGQRERQQERNAFLPYHTIDVIRVFDALLAGRKNGRKLQCLCANPVTNNLFFFKY